MTNLVMASLANGELGKWQIWQLANLANGDSNLATGESGKWQTLANGTFW